MLDAFPQGVSWKWSLGYGRDITRHGTASLRYDLTDGDFVAGFSQGFAHDFLLRYEYRWTDRLGEFGLRYKLHDFLSVEYAVDKDDSWLRFIGNF